MTLHLAWLRAALLFAVSFLAVSERAAQAQASGGHHQSTIPVGIRFVATEANSPPGSCGCFWLKGAALDAAVPLPSRFSAVVEASGITVDRVPASTRGLSEIMLLAGPRYTVPLRHTNINAQALFGAVHGFDSDFVSSPNRADTSTNFAMALGGSVEIPLTGHLSLRAIQADYVQTNLPNGSDNRQRNIRLGTGIVFHVPLPQAR